MAFSNAIVEQIRAEAGTFTGIQTFNESTILLDDDGSIGYEFDIDVDTLDGDRTLTLPNEDVDLGDISDLNTNVALLLASLNIGVANRDWIVTAFAEESGDAREQKFTALKLRSNIGSADPQLYFVIPLPTNRGGLKLYIDGIRYYVLDGDANDYIDNTILVGIDDTGGLNNVDTNTTNVGAGGSEAYADSFTAIDCSSYRYMLVHLDPVFDGAGECDFTEPEVRYFYDS